MNKQVAIFWAVIALMGLMALYFAIRLDMDEPVKPEIEVDTVTTNIPATIITWTKTVNGRQVIWGFATAGSNTFILFPITK